MAKATLSKSKFHNTSAKLNYEEQQAATPPAHLQAEGLSKSIERISEGRDATVSR